jgi:hypothetical protein
MLRSAAIAFGLVFLSAAPAVAANTDDDKPACYDTMVVGRLLDSSNFVSLDDLLGPPPQDPDRPDVMTIRFGGRDDWLIRVEAASGRKRVPAHTMTVRVVTASLPVRNSTLVFYLRKLENGRWFAIDWDWAGRDWQGRYMADSDNGPPQCER